MIYFTADTHFNHSDTKELFGRPFNDVEQMNETIIRNWNEYVKNDDEIYILGDLGFETDGLEAEKTITKLNGKKYFIKGNNDHFLDDKDFNKSHFEWIKDYYTLIYREMKIILFHYPIFIWDGYYEKSTVHLYGHIHNMSNNKKEYDNFIKSYSQNAINVGVDVNNFYPVSIEKIVVNI